ncbi:hypothetical protein GCM10010452_46640 [Crossiella cryophila]
MPEHLGQGTSQLISTSGAGGGALGHHRHPEDYREFEEFKIDPPGELPASAAV